MINKLRELIVDFTKEYQKESKTYVTLPETVEVIHANNISVDTIVINYPCYETTIDQEIIRLTKTVDCDYDNLLKRKICEFLKSKDIHEMHGTLTFNLFYMDRDLTDKMFSAFIEEINEAKLFLKKQSLINMFLCISDSALSVMSQMFLETNEINDKLIKYYLIDFISMLQNTMSIYNKEQFESQIVSKFMDYSTDVKNQILADYHAVFDYKNRFSEHSPFSILVNQISNYALINERDKFGNILYLYHDLTKDIYVSNMF